MIIRARCLLPMDGAPIDNGALAVEEGRVTWIGRWRDCEVPAGATRLDLGEVALLPGLVNAHCHLDYTSMAGQIPPQRFFPDWIKTILSFKAHWSFSEFAESWLKGARMLIDRGNTTVADIESAPELLPEVWKATPLRVISFIEMTGVKSQRAGVDILRETLTLIDDLPEIPGKETGLSPHALYSTNPDLTKAVASLMREKDVLVSTHLAESESEFRMFCKGEGPFYDWLRGQRNMADCGSHSPVSLAESYGLLSDRFLAVHVNYLAPADAERLARSGASVVHCPRSHEYFGHDPFPYEELSNAGLNICLGTDSLASVRRTGSTAPELDPWQEMRVFAHHHPGVAPRTIFEMVTTRAARALHKEGQIGVLGINAWADAVALGYIGPVLESKIFEEILYTAPVREVLLGGEVVRNV